MYKIGIQLNQANTQKKLFIMTWFLIKLEMYKEWEIKHEQVQHISTTGKWYCLKDSYELFAF